MPAGQPTLYDPSYAKQAEKLCALGATNADLADFFEVSIRTIDRWIVAHEEFCRAVKLNKDVADESVERSLFQRARGYTFDSEEIKVVAGAVERIKTREHVPPDTTAAIFWLKNRKPDDWREKQTTELTGKDGAPLTVQVVRFAADDKADETKPFMGGGYCD